MRGTFDFNKEQYPFLVQNVGINEVVIRNQLTGEEIDRQLVVGERGSDERKEQNERLEAEAVRLSQEARNSRVASEPQPYTPTVNQ